MKPNPLRRALRLGPVLAFVFASFAGAAPSRTVVGTELIDGMPCSGKVEFHEGGRLMRATLAREHEIAGNVLPAGTRVSFHEDGRLRECHLDAAGAVLSGRPLPKGTEVVFDGGGRLRNCLLPENTMIEGHLCLGKGTHWSTGFHPNGQLRLAWLARDEEIQGVPCLAAGGVLRAIGKALVGRNQGGVFFHGNGNLSSALVSRDCVVQGRAFKRGELIRLDRDGNVQP
ncbi:MAG: hypothetical protein ACKPB0_08785 [Opitutaceae bacterium]